MGLTNIFVFEGLSPSGGYIRVYPPEVKGCLWTLEQYLGTYLSPGLSPREDLGIDLFRQDMHIDASAVHIHDRHYGSHLKRVRQAKLQSQRTAIWTKVQSNHLRAL